ncbi:MAG TPA: ParA family protein [Oligoflexus sp.]|uniref:ParA family protein n=1 Tax=Oligoflexus sp. TaxID=1971216 RepID=UPI002D803928|nr:ParA family protein [Oligoflexus sp.]HET9239190.1 ParA family protein [Oligoflexus sp.]
MKSQVLANQKGGVGKSAVAVQMAYFFYLLMNKRVLVVDLDHQGNTSKAIAKSGLAAVSRISASQILTSKDVSIEDGAFVVISADDELRDLEKQGSRHNEFANNFYSFLKAMDQKFDICLIDTNPNPDIRQLAALVVCDFVLSPIQLNQEAIDGIGDLLNHERTGIRKIKAAINPKLELIGILPNIVEPTPFQRENLTELSAHFARLLIPLQSGGFAAIKKTTAIPEAQAAGLPVWKLGKTCGREAWTHIRPVFEKIAATMGVH